MATNGNKGEEEYRHSCDGETRYAKKIRVSYFTERIVGRFLLRDCMSL